MSSPSTGRAQKQLHRCEPIWNTTISHGCELISNLSVLELRPECFPLTQVPLQNRYLPKEASLAVTLDTYLCLIIPPFSRIKQQGSTVASLVEVLIRTNSPATPRLKAQSHSHTLVRSGSRRRRVSLCYCPWERQVSKGSW